jgi:hypothetical protein
MIYDMHVYIYNIHIYIIFKINDVFIFYLKCTQIYNYIILKYILKKLFAVNVFIHEYRK